MPTVNRRAHRAAFLPSAHSFVDVFFRRRIPCAMHKPYRQRGAMPTRLTVVPIGSRFCRRRILSSTYSAVGVFLRRRIPCATYKHRRERGAMPTRLITYFFAMV